MNMTNGQTSVRRRVGWQLFLLLLAPGFGSGLGLASYHFHWRHAIQARYSQEQITFGLDLFLCAFIALVVFAVARRVRNSTGG